MEEKQDTDTFNVCEDNPNETMQAECPRWRDDTQGESGKGIASDSLV